MLLCCSGTELGQRWAYMDQNEIQMTRFCVNSRYQILFEFVQ